MNRVYQLNSRFASAARLATRDDLNGLGKGL